MADGETQKRDEYAEMMKPASVYKIFCSKLHIKANISWVSKGLFYIKIANKIILINS